jgi:hypothetical protein
MRTPLTVRSLDSGSTAVAATTTLRRDAWLDLIPQRWTILICAVGLLNHA